MLLGQDDQAAISAALSVDFPSQEDIEQAKK
jgi:hypothetical protein